MTTTASIVFQGSAQTVTDTALDSLASDTNLLAGWQCAAIDMTASLGATGGNLALDLDFMVSMTTGASPTTARQIEIWMYGSADGSTYPTGITGSQGTLSLAHAGIKSLLNLINIIPTDGTQRTYVHNFSLLRAWGGLALPSKVGLWIVQNTGQAFTASTIKFQARNISSA